MANKVKEISPPLKTGINRLLKPACSIVRWMVLIILLASAFTTQSHAMPPTQTLPGYMIYLPIVAKSPPVVPFSNGNFESGNSGWVEFSSNGWSIIMTADDLPGEVTPRSGSYAAWLGGDTNELGYIERWVTINASTSYLTFYRWITSDAAPGTDFASIKVNGMEVESFDLSNETQTAAWEKVSIPLGAYAGQLVLLRFEADIDGDFNVSDLFIDDVVFSASP